MKSINDAIQMVIDTNQKLLAGIIKVDVANQIAINTQTIINYAKIRLEYMKFAGIKNDAFFDTDLSIEKQSPEVKAILSVSNNTVVPEVGIPMSEDNQEVKKKDKIEKVKESVVSKKKVCTICGNPTKTGSDLCDGCLKTKYNTRLKRC